MPVTPISFAWKRWAAFSLMSGESLESVADRMAREGIDRAVAMHVCIELMDSPTYAAGDWMSQRLRKLESILDVLRALRALDDRPRSITRVRDLSREDFFNDFYATNTPVVLQDVATNWPAIIKWNAAYFAAMMGDEEVEVMADRDADPHYERQAHAHRSKMLLRAYIEKVLSCSPSNDIYMVANNRLLDSEAAGPLWQDFRVDQRYLTPQPAESSVFLWFGPEGTFTPLHHDVINVLFVQVLGLKRFVLISPLESHCVSNNVGVHSDVDIRCPDPVRFPRFGSTDRISLVLRPGEALFIPVGWWHCVEALEISASLSFTNFVYPNSYSWTQPEIKF
jgi:hypothetical protein